MNNPCSGESGTPKYYVELSEDLLGESFPDHLSRWKVSFVVPTMNNEKTLKEALLSFRAQDFENKEILVIDGGSSDHTLEIADKYADRTLIVRGPCGLAVHHGVKEAGGNIVALFDSDVMLPARDWLSVALRGFCCSDRISTVWPLNAPPPSSAMLTKYYFRHWNAIVEDRIRFQRGLLGGGNSLYRTDLITSVTPLAMNVHWGDDFVRSRELRKRGFQIAVLRRPILHNTMIDFRQFYKKQKAGAETFVGQGFETMGLTLEEVLYEQYVLGAISMLRGIAQGDPSSLLFPPYMAARTFAYMMKWVAKIP